jgi:hypothetical protein
MGWVLIDSSDASKVRTSMVKINELGQCPTRRMLINYSASSMHWADAIFLPTRNKSELRHQQDAGYANDDFDNMTRGSWPEALLTFKMVLSI